MQHELINSYLQSIRKEFSEKFWEVDLNSKLIRVHSDKALTNEQSLLLKNAIESMISWRQGPYQVFDYHLNSEWFSNIKWERLKSILPDLSNLKVADVGCSNGYFMFKLLTLNPEAVYGFDPFKNCHYQYQLLSHFIRDERLKYVTAGVEDLINFPEAFDLILMMGVLYHRRDPVQAIKNLYQALKPNGKVLLETMVFPGDSEGPIEIPGRYSKMKNIYFLSTISGLISWSKQAGFNKFRIISVSQTSSEEQRVTELAPYESLAEFLNPADNDYTVEGLPAPRRVLLELHK